MVPTPPPPPPLNLTNSSSRSITNPVSSLGVNFQLTDIGSFGPIQKCPCNGENHGVFVNEFNKVQFIVKHTPSHQKPPHNANLDFIMYVNIRPVLQIGPTCGLQALSIIANLVVPITVADLLSRARSLGFSHQGEMFSAKYLYQLAIEAVGDYCDVTLDSNNLFSDRPCEVWENLLNNVIYLVPYDKDKNNFPGEFDGYKAHWAVIFGCSSYKGENYYIAAQGKSSKIAMWPTHLLGPSNKGLIEVNPRHQDPEEFVTGDLKSELAGHSIRISFKKHINIPVVVSTEDEDVNNCIYNLHRLIP